jgi:hypothetical protein
MERTIARRLIHPLHLVETSIPRFGDRPPGPLRLMGTSHFVLEMVTWRHRSISRLMQLFTKYAREVAKLLPSDKSNPAARKTRGASTGLALEQISGFDT